MSLLSVAGRAPAAAPVILAPPQPVSPAVLAEIEVITEDNYDRLVPAGREVDAIVGDYVLRNDRIVAVIGRPVEGRNANTSARDVGGCIIDLTLRDRPNDLLTLFAPGAGKEIWRDPLIAVDGQMLSGRDAAPARGRKVTLTLASRARGDKPAAHLTYALEAGAASMEIVTRSDGEARTTRDLIRVDGPSFERSPAGRTGLVWAYDAWFGQAYGVFAPGRTPSVRTHDDRTTITWGETRDAFRRHLYPGDDLFAVMGTFRRQRGELLRAVSLVAVEPDGLPVPGADVVALRGERLIGRGRTGADGVLDAELPAGAFALIVSSPGRGERQLDIGRDDSPDGSRPSPRLVRAVLEAAASVTGVVTGGRGEPIPCKVMFVGVRGTPTPDFGPIVTDEQVKNLIYTPDGRFTRILPPGDYDVTASHGPEHDAVTRRIHVPPGPAEVPFAASLRRSVATPGWISADFHGHSTSSGDNAAGRRGRVLNYAAEGVEFAPCTEHNRIDTYVPIIEELGLGGHLATSDGIELTGRPLPLNHQNAFPLVMRPRTQGNGAPLPSADPVAQIRRLASWDDGSEKLVQQNHPDIGWLFFDRDGDRRHDHGHDGIEAYQDVMEVWTEPIDLTSPMITLWDDRASGTRTSNRLFNWLQLLNQGVRLPGVANTDAHHNFHGSGGVRNYVRSATDAPATIDPIAIVREAERGRIVMTNGPYLEVSLEPIPATGAPRAIPGDDVAAPGGRAALHVRVQCPNWFDVDRVQVLLNGRPADRHSFARAGHPERFGDGAVKFDQRIELTLTGDAHVIVVASHGETLLRPIMGPRWGRQPPVAISNPIYVDVDGGGFAPSGDTLDHLLPVKGR